MTLIICVFFGLLSAVAIFFTCKWVVGLVIFKYDPTNPYRRHCKKCNAHQIMYSSNIEGHASDIWWQEVYPIGNNEKCICHSYSDYRS